QRKLAGVVGDLPPVRVVVVHVQVVAVVGGDQRRRLVADRDHALGLGQDLLLAVELPLVGGVVQHVVGDGVPEQERQPRGHLVARELYCVSFGRRGQLRDVDERRRNQEGVERGLGDLL